MVSSAVARRIMKEILELRKNPPEGVRVQASDEDMLNVTGIIQGPEGTPYAGGYFKVKFRFTEEFPTAPPKCWFATKIFHPNVSSAGEICVNTLKKDWQSSYGIGHILITVKCLLIYPNPESALDEEAGKLLLEDYDSYFSRAKLITGVHATPRAKPSEFDEPPPGDDSAPVTSSTKPASSKSSTNSSSTTPAHVKSPPAVQKASSPPPQLHPLKAALSAEKAPLAKEKDRHPSPSPLSTADANVGPQHKPVPDMNLGVTNNTLPSGTTKAVKRAATGSAPTNAEKRKKALKRL